jgi:hypothetical protein
MTYSEKLRDPKWQKKRLEIMDRDGFACVICSDKKSTLNVHHQSYLQGLAPWEYPNETLFTVCERCHGKLEDMKRAVAKMVCSKDGNWTLNAFLNLYFTETGFELSVLCNLARVYPVAFRGLIETIQDINGKAWEEAAAEFSKSLQNEPPLYPA